MFNLLYKSMARSYLESAVCVCYPYKIKAITQIENVQRRATKMIPELKSMPYDERLRKLNLPTLQYRRQRGDMIQMFKMMINIYDKDVIPEIKLRDEIVTSHINTRGNSKKSIKKSNKEVARNAFLSRASKVWNTLPEEITQVDIFSEKMLLGNGHMFLGYFLTLILKMKSVLPHHIRFSLKT